jgi:sporulation protein YlmC with PRC-barrel domain
MLDTTNPEALTGLTVVDRDGDKIGKIDDVYVDNSGGRHLWAAVNTGLFGLKSTFVPLDSAEQADGDTVRVPFEKDHVKDAPNVDPEGQLTPEEENRLFSHYGMGTGRFTPGQSGGTMGGLEESRLSRWAVSERTPRS